MQTISSLKEQAVTDTPLILFDCVLSNGDAEHWCTHAVSVNNVAYTARVLAAQLVRHTDGFGSGG